MNVIKRNNNVNFPSIIDELFRPDWLGGVAHVNGNLPAVNLKEADTNFTIELAAPGMKKEDFNIEIDHNVLSISSETQSQNEEKDNAGKYTRREFNYASFRRTFTLPDSVNTEEINASYESGVLLLTLPKKEEALPKPKRLIEIA